MTRVALVIPAAGRGVRFSAANSASLTEQADRPKQFLDLGGQPVLAWTLAAFAGVVDAAWLAVDDAWRPEVERIAKQAPFPCTVVRGGDTRQASVHAALLSVDATCDYVLVHDAVRPLVPRSCIQACLHALLSHPAAVVAVPCAATIKRAAADGSVETTVPRENLWLAQTPQGFQRVAGLRAFAEAAAAGVTGTDDVQLFERLGLKVALVPGDARNFKITTPDDLALARALVRAQVPEQPSSPPWDRRFLTGSPG